MMQWLLPLGVFLVTFTAAFSVSLNAIPGMIMDKAMTRIATAGGNAGGVLHAPRTTPENQTIVRPSPDILYSVCTYDLADGPLAVTAPWPADGNYASVSFYDARTNNFAVVSDRDSDGPLAELALVRHPETGGAGEIVSPTDPGD